MSVGELDKYVCRPSSSSARSGATLGGRGFADSPGGGAGGGGAGGAAGGGSALGKRRAGAEDGAGLGAETAGSQAVDAVGAGGEEEEAESSGGVVVERRSGPLRVPSGRCGAKRVALSRAAQRPWAACELSSVASLLRGVYI